jgi:hypothetical protein
LDLKTVWPLLNYNFSSESELIKAISLIGHNFTKSREDIGDYIKDDKMVAAYTCFYLLTNIPKLKEAFRKTEINFSNYSPEDWEFIDIGAGPGTFSLALLEMNSETKIKAIEQSDKMISQGQKLINGIYPDADFEYFSSFKGLPSKVKKRFGIFGHSANEMDPNLVAQMIDSLELDQILFIEPGTKDFFGKSLIIRKKLLKTFTLNYPCMHSASCPLPEGDWCHQYIKVQHEADVERITQLAQRDRRNLPIILNLYTKDQVVQDQTNSRIVRVYRPTKFSSEWQVCNKLENENVIQDLQIMHRGYSKKEIKVLSQVLAGEKIKFSMVKDLGDNKVRGKLL